MRLSRAAYPALAASCLLALLSACGSSKSSNVNGEGDGSGGNASTGATTGRRHAEPGAGGSAIDGNNAGSGGAGTLLQRRAHPARHVRDARRLRLDAGADRGRCQRDQVASRQLRVDRLRQRQSLRRHRRRACKSFRSAIAHADAPTMCTSDTECGTYGPCINRGCWALFGGPLNTCLDDTGCERGQTCVVIGECSADNTNVCDHDATTTCMDLGRGNCASSSPLPGRSAIVGPPRLRGAGRRYRGRLPGAQANLVKVITAAAPDAGRMASLPTGPALGGYRQSGVENLGQSAHGPPGRCGARD